jgi:site-specific DNA recombinase
MERLALYLRSTKDRHDVSVESQRRELAAHAESKSYATTAVFEDKVQSAKTDDRPAFQEMIAEAGRPDRRFDVILCLDTSRFARNATDAKIYKDYLRLKRGVRVEFVKLPTTDSYMDPLLETLMEGIDQLHSQKSKSDGLRGMRENVLKGFRAGGSAPIGYKLDKIVTGTREGVPVTKSKLIRDPETFTVIQAYLERRASGHSRPDSASLTGLDISTGTFVGIEDNALVYAGHTVWNRHNEKIKGGYRGGIKVRPRAEWEIHLNTHEAMISDIQAEQILAQRALKSASQRRGRRSPYLLAGLLRCTCGANFCQ